MAVPESTSAGTAPTFDSALRAAIRASGLTLQRLQARLRHHDVHVSVATLSSWQTGQNRPERRASLRAVAELEALLGVEPDGLITLLGPKRPRGRQPAGTGAHRYDLVPRGGAAARLLLESGLERPVDFELLAQEDLVVLGSGRRLLEVRTRVVGRVLADGVAGHVVVELAEEGQRADELHVDAGADCRLGRTGVDVDHGLRVAELIFDRPTFAGEAVTFDYVVRVGQPTTDCEYFRAFTRPCRLHLVQTHFVGDEVPVRCTAFQDTRSGGRTEFPLVVAGRRAHSVAASSDVRLHGVRWEWPEPSTSREA